MKRWHNRSWLSGTCLTALLALSPSVAPAQGLSAPLGGGAGSVPAASPAPNTAAAPDALASVPADYRVDIGDTISVDVPRHPDVTKTLLIPADGQIILPKLRAPIDARGKTCAELSQELSEGWRHVFVLRPGQVTVAVAGQRMRRIYVRGSAVKGGEFDLKPHWRVSNLAAVLGGVPQADRVVARITNERRPEPSISVDLEAALNASGSPEDVPLLEGDTLTLDAPKAIRLLIVGEGPRGEHEIDNRYGLRRALGQLKFSPYGATGSLKDARIYRKRVPGDPISVEEVIPVDLLRVMNGEAKDIALRDMDLLHILPTNRQVYVLGETGRGIQNMREDRPTYLLDVMATAGYTASAKIGEIGILRKENGVLTKKAYDFGKFLKDQDPKNNPELMPQDIVFVPQVGRKFQIGDIFTGWSVFQIFKTLTGTP